MSARITTPLRLLLAVLAVAAVGALGTSPAHATGQPPAFTQTSTGTWSLRPWGDALVYGPGEHAIRAGQPRDVTVAAVISPFDRSLPAAGECEGAHGWVTIISDQKLRDAWLIGIGEVCGVHAQPPTSIVTHVYNGSFEVWEGSQPFLGAEGFMEIRLAQDGTGSSFTTTY